MRPLLLLLILAGCGDDDKVHHLPDAPPIPEAAKGIYVTSAGNRIDVFPLDRTGDVAPMRTIMGPTTGLDLSLGFDVEPGTGDLFVANRQGGTVTVYAPESTGDVAPKKTITAQGMDSPASIAFTPEGDMFVATCPNCGAANGGSIGVFHFPAGAAESDGTLGATSNANTMFTNPSVSRDPGSGNLVIANSFGGVVATFPADARGDVAPERTFSPGSINVQAVTVAADTVWITSGTGAPLLTFPLDATGTPLPAATIANGGMLSVDYPGGMFVDLSTGAPVGYLVDYGGNKLHIIHFTGSAPAWTVGAVETIEGPSTGLASPIGIRVVR